jgi:RNA polymerase subunit RPABC4/transcription elongation factor Spt4
MKCSAINVMSDYDMEKGMMQMRMKARSPNEDASRFGFGIDVMKETKVCKQCGAATVAEKHVCSHCGAKLPQESLFQFYQRMHRLCPLCDTVLSARMRFCPYCGLQQSIATASFQRKSG